MQSFLGSLNYYSRFIEDFAVYAAIVYELREADFHEIARMDAEETQAEDSQLTGGERDRWARAKNAFTMLKVEIIATPVLKLFDPERTAVVVHFANKWAISAALMQEHEGVYHPVTFTSRPLKANELNYGVPRKMITMPPPTIEPDENLWVVSFDGSARVKRSGGAYSADVWKLPEWTVVEGMSEYMTDLTVNEAEYHGLILGFDLLSTLDRGRVVICGDSNLVIRQMQGEMDCKAPGLQLLRQKALNRLRSWPKHDFLHVKREWNQSADKLASAALHREEGEIVTSEDDRQDLITLNRLGEAKVDRDSRQQAQDEEKWIADLKKYLDGEVSVLTAEEAKTCSKIAANYEVDENGLLFFCPKMLQRGEDRDGVVKM
ncbi:reverse transcriptase, partial [Phytophthora megakarya]